MTEILQNHEDSIQIEHEPCQSRTYSEYGNNQYENAREEILPNANCRYRRYKQLKINPICSESQDEQQTVLNFDCHTNLNIPKTTLLREKKIKKKQRHREAQRAKKQNKTKPIIMNSMSFQQEKCEWDERENWGLPDQCQQINRQYKKVSYNELHHSILACVEAKCKTRTIFLAGNKQTAKKTILFDVINQIKSNQQRQLTINEYYLNFQEELTNNIQDKIAKLFKFLKRTVQIPSKAMNQGQNLKRQWLQFEDRGGYKVQNILILDDYKSFILTLKQSSKYKYFKKLIRHNTSNLLIFIDSNVSSKQIQMLTCHNFIQIQVISNAKEYFVRSLLAAINNYPFKNSHWELITPMANYFSAKMDENHQLHLSFIRKLIFFLEKQAKGAQMTMQKRRVNRQILQKFTRKYIDRTIKIDLTKLAFHEKAVLTACYLVLKKNPQIFIVAEKVFKTYVWICQSVCIRAKEFREFAEDVMFHLSIYKLIKVEKCKKIGRESQILINTDIELIAGSLHREIGLSKFYAMDE